MKKVIIAGGTGLIGKKLTQKLKYNGYRVSILSRDANKSKKIAPNADEHFSWSDINFIEQFENTFAVVNLAGASVADGRWTKNYKKEILESRIESTKRIVTAINVLQIKPKVLMNISGIDYYGETFTDTDENAPKGNGFLSDVCLDWENTAKQVDASVRLVLPRVGMVLDEKGGALSKLVPPFMMFAGGPLGNGKQWIPFIHIDDLTSSFIFMLENENISGAVNCSTTKPVTMKEFANILGRVLHRPSIFPVPSLILKLILGASSEIVLKGRKVIPSKLTEAGFKFKYADLDIALKNLLVKIIVKFQK